MLLFCNQGSSTNDTKLLIVLGTLVLVVLLLPKTFLAVAGRVVVGWAWAVTLLPLAGAAEDYFKSCGYEK